MEILKRVENENGASGGKTCIKDNKNKLDAFQTESIKQLIGNVFDIVLEDWIHGYTSKYSKQDNIEISDLIMNQLPLTFLLPSFPAKSSNIESKVLGIKPDFTEFLAIQSLIKTLRKIEAIYQHGTVMIILSDYHTFDQFVNVRHEDYVVYHKELVQMINDTGADDIIKVISLSSFPEFNDVPSWQVARALRERYGERSTLTDFHETLDKDPALLAKYLGLKKFMLNDLAGILPGGKNSKRTRNFIRNVARGMIQQGLALDRFLQQQTLVRNFIRFSIHNHHPNTRKNTIDMFKHSACCSGMLRTPWHHCIVFDTLSGDFIVNYKANIVETDYDGASLMTARCKGIDWLFIRLYFTNELLIRLTEIDFDIEMIRNGCGIILTNKTKSNKDNILKSDCIRPQSLTNIIKQFGVVVLRGFNGFKNEESFINYYRKRATNGIVPWKFGMLKKVMPDKCEPGFVNSKESLPIHFDLSNPPRYMKIKQSEYRYEEYICREFLLYCRISPENYTEGATTFVDAHGVVQALNGATKEKWKRTIISYETDLSGSSDKELYFGGRGNTYEYPLVHVCPWTGKDVLRWGQSWTTADDPSASQYIFLSLKSTPSFNHAESLAELESEIKRHCFDDRFFFSHHYQIEDQVYVNNYTMLHGREGFSTQRELWRLQAIPPSNKTPAHFLQV